MLEKYLQLAIRAHQGTSFFPEKRGESYVQEFGQQLADDLEKIEGAENKEYYQKKYESLFVAWMSAKGRCLSCMITGPARFPTARAEKANRAEEARGKEFFAFRTKYFERQKLLAYREARAKIDPLEQLEKEIKGAENLQSTMIEANKIIRKKISDEEKIRLLVELPISEAAAKELLKPDYANRIGFAQYQLSNNSANIRRMKDRLTVLNKRAQRVEKETVREDGISIVENVAMDRLQIFFPGKPDATIISALKRSTFKWSPSNGCWQRQLTENAKEAAAKIISSINTKA